jgi:hypothetical protein
MEDEMNNDEPSEDTGDEPPLTNSSDANINGAAADSDETLHSDAVNQDKEAEKILVPHCTEIGTEHGAEEGNGDVSYFSNSENGVSPNEESPKYEAEKYGNGNLLHRVDAEEYHKESLAPTPDSEEDEKPDPTQQKGAPENGVDITLLPLEEESAVAAVPMSPGRHSTVSSIGSTMNGDTEGDDDEESVAGVAIGPLVLFGCKAVDTSSSIIDEINLSNSLMNDEKSIRSESTRPDPPSILDGQNPSDHDENGDYSGKEWDDTEVQVGVQEAIEEVDYHRANSNDAPATTIAYQDSEEEAAQALATLSINVAEATLQDDDKEAPERGLQENGRASHDITNDLDRNLVLAETPEGDVKSIATSLDSASLAVPLEPEEEKVVHLGYRQIVGPDNLVVLPRVDEHRFYSPPPPPPGPPVATQAHSFQPPSPSLIQQQLQMPSFENPQARQGSYGYAPRAQTGGPSIMMGMSTSGRRKIRLRLQEEVRNSNSSLKKHFRSGSLLGTIRKSSTRMLRFGGSARSLGKGDELEAGPELYKTVDRGSIAVSWYEGTSTLELQQHVRKSVIRKLKFENTSVELDDLRILDESIDPPEGTRRNARPSPKLVQRLLPVLTLFAFSTCRNRVVSVHARWIAVSAAIQHDERKCQRQNQGVRWYYDTSITVFRPPTCFAVSSSKPPSRERSPKQSQCKPACPAEFSPNSDGERRDSEEEKESA